MGVLASFLWSFVDLRTAGVLVAVWWTTQWLIWKGYLFTKGRQVPPGIYGVPLLGCIPYFWIGWSTTFESLENYAKRYGPVIRLRLGFKQVTLINGTAAVREGMLNDALLGRPPQNFQDDELNESYTMQSIGSIEGEVWKKHRRFSLVTLRDLGFGKTPIMERLIQEEVREMISAFDSHNGEPMDVRKPLVPSMANNMATLILGERLPVDDLRRKHFTEVLSSFNDEQRLFVILALIPKLLKVLHRFNIGVARRIKEAMGKFRKIFQDEVERHRAELDKQQPRDYIDYYIVEQDKDTCFTDELAAGNAMAFFSAGSSTVRITVEYLLHLMAAHPEIQQKVQAEIDEVTGRSREVVWADNTQLVYTMAVIAERHRYFTVAPLSVPRRALVDTKVCGFDIRAKDEVMFNIDSVHFDRKTFPDPYSFKPERFIQDGKLVNTEKIWAFAIGKRACPGESLAVLEVFLYFTNILQNFTVKPESDDGQVKLPRPRCFVADTICQNVRLISRN